MSAENFLSTLEQSGLVAPNVVSSLRAQISNSATPVSAEQIAKLLVDKGRLGPDQAQQLLAQQASAPAAVATVDQELGLTPMDDGLTPLDDGLTPLDDTNATQPAPTPNPDLMPLDGGMPAAPTNGNSLTPMGNAVPAQPAAPAQGLTPIGDAGGLQPLDASGGLQPVDAGGGLQPLDAGGGLQPLDGGGGLQPLDAGGGLQPLGGDPMAGGMGGMDATAQMDPMAQQQQQQQQPDPDQLGHFSGKKVEKHWQNKIWPFVGSGGLVLLIILVGWLVFVLTRGDAQVMWEAAEDAYNSESYTEAATLYEDFFNAFPSDEKASLARCRFVLAQLWGPTKNGQFEKALSEAQTKLKTILEEDALATAREETRSILPTIALGFVKKANSLANPDEKQDQLDFLSKTMELVNNSAYVSGTDKKAPAIAKRLDEIEELKRNVERDIGKSRAKTKTLAEIKALKSASQANNKRIELIREYPELLSDKDLIDAVAEIAAQERALIKLVDDTYPTNTEDYPRTTRHAVVAVNRVGNQIDTLRDEMLVVLAEGSAYGIKAANGEVIWRKFIGYESQVYPIPVSPTPGADTILVNAKSNELLRVATGTGKVMWRTTIGEDFADPVVAGEHIYVATYAGKLLDISTETGESFRQATFPEGQNLVVGPAVYEQYSYMYQVGEHSNMYSLNLAKVSDEEQPMSCREVFFIGHKKGTIVVPPFVVRGHILVAENRGEDYCLLHCILGKKRGSDLERTQPPIRIPGNVILPMVLSGRQILVMTNTGQIKFFEIHLGEKEPLAEVLSESSPIGEPLATFAHIERGAMWYAAKGLTKYRPQIAAGTISTDWIKYANDTFVGPPIKLGETLVTIRRRAGRSGVSVSAMNGEDGAVLWRTDLGVSRIGPPIVHSSGQKLVSVSSQGNLFEFDGTALTSGLVNAPALRPTATEQHIVLTETAVMPGGSSAFIGEPNSNLSPTKRLITYDSNLDNNPLRLRNVEVPDGTATAGTVLFKGGLLLPWSGGQVLCLDVDTGQNRILPFQPPLKPGASVRWQRPAVLDDGESYIVTDDRNAIYQVKVIDQPQPHMEATNQANLTQDLVSPLAAIGKTVYAVANVAGAHQVVGYSTENLGSTGENALVGRVKWGPQRIGNAVYLTTDESKFVCLDEDNKVRWTIDLPYGPLAGLPLEIDSDLILASTSGTIWRISAATGEGVGEAVSTNVPFGSGAIQFKNLLWLNAKDGSLHSVPNISP